MMTIYGVTKKLLRPGIPEVRKYERAFPVQRPKSRRTPTAKNIWKEYVTAMITSQQRSTQDFWIAINSDPRWNRLRDGGQENCPNEKTILTIFKENGVRFPSQKAERLRKAADRDFEGIARDVRERLGRSHDRFVSRDVLRGEEVSAAVYLQEELGGCGVAPKIARLILRLAADPIRHIIPIDSRWMNALRDGGGAIEVSDLSNETSYRVVEDEIARAAYDVGIPPTLADGVIFGWVGRALERGSVR